MAQERVLSFLWKLPFLSTQFLRGYLSGRDSRHFRTKVTKKWIFLGKSLGNFLCTWDIGFSINQFLIKKICVLYMQYIHINIYIAHSIIGLANDRMCNINIYMYILQWLIVSVNTLISMWWLPGGGFQKAVFSLYHS